MPSIGEDEPVADESAVPTTSLLPVDPVDTLQQLLAQSKLQYEERMEKMTAAQKGGDGDGAKGDEPAGGAGAEDDSIGAGAMDFLACFEDSSSEEEGGEEERELGPGASLADYLDALEARNR